MTYADRSTVVAFAAALDGISANPANPEARAHYLDTIAPGETPARAAEMACMSGCALIARAVLRAFCDHPLLAAPYVTGRAVADVAAIARDAGALHPPGRALEPGDVVIVGGGADGGGPEHVWLALCLRGDGAWDGLDGGQRDAAGHQAVKVRVHHVEGGYDRAHDDGAGGGVRRKVRAVVDVERVVAAFGRG